MNEREPIRRPRASKHPGVNGVLPLSTPNAKDEIVVLNYTLPFPSEYVEHYLGNSFRPTLESGR